MRILLVGGGTGGHVYPLVAVAEELQKLSNQSASGIEFLVLTDDKRWADEFVKINIKSKIISAGKWRRYFSILNFTDIFKFIFGWIQSLWHILVFMPDVIFTKGGYVSVPPSLAGFFYLIPIFTHESDYDPGLANKVIAKLAKNIFVAFDGLDKFFNPKKLVLVGNPMRSGVFKGLKENALRAFGFSETKKTILVLGGTQGARRINELILNSLVALTRDFQIIHQTGGLDFSDVQNMATQLIKEGGGSYGVQISTNYKFVPFLELQNLADSYALADVIITRAGANTLAEVAVLGKPVIVIPIPESVSHDQVQNAKAIERFGAVVLEEENLASHIFINQLSRIMEPNFANQIKQKLNQFSKPDAAIQIASSLINFTNQKL